MRVLLVDEHRLFREGLCALLRAGGHVEVVGQAANAREAYVMVNRQRPDLVMMELALPGVDGVTAAREIRRLRPECKLVVITGCKERRLLQAAWHSGIDACMTKDESADTLFAALATLGAGRRFIAPALRKTGSSLRVIDDDHRHDDDSLAQLSLREREIFDLVVRGFTTKAVARELCISAKTVETHRAHINEKLAAHCSADLVRYAFQHGIRLSLAASSMSEQRDPEPHKPMRPRRRTARKERRASL
jgi:DNA-binding NarL/FixJ family response regulator